MSTASAAPTTTIGITAANAAIGVGFKEWSVVCEALGSGRQSLILRKGGIAEGREGFRFKHEHFFLFPTQYHQQFDKVRSEEREGIADPAQTLAGTVAIRLYFAVNFACWVDDWERLVRLKPLHIWRDAVVRERFDYEDHRGLQCAFGRVYHSESVWTFPDRPSYGGCRSWVSLPAPPPDLRWTTVLDQSEHDRRRQEIQHILGVE